jgi:hypothetical protein
MAQRGVPKVRLVVVGVDRAFHGAQMAYEFDAPIVGVVGLRTMPDMCRYLTCLVYTEPFPSSPHQGARCEGGGFDEASSTTTSYCWTL